jgi:hypothetical protein
VETIQNMNTNEKTLLSPELLAELQDAAAYAAKGVRDPKVMKQASDRMDRMREEIYRNHGMLDIGVPAIRELRDE